MQKNVMVFTENLMCGSQYWVAINKGFTLMIFFHYALEVNGT